MIEAATKNSELKPYYVNRLERGLRGETPISREGQVLSRLQEKGLGIRENAPSRETADTLRNRGRMGKPDDVAAIVAHQRTGRKRNGILFLVYEKGQDRPPKLVTKTELENKDAELVRAYMEKVAGGGGQEADLAQLNLATRPYGREEYGPDGARDRSTGPVVSYGGVEVPTRTDASYRLWGRGYRPPPGFLVTMCTDGSTYPGRPSGAGFVFADDHM